jgi:hypothetical protein
MRRKIELARGATHGDDLVANRTGKAATYGKGERLLLAAARVPAGKLRVRRDYAGERLQG